jgi:sugar phosphate isomerase/epimerase
VKVGLEGTHVFDARVESAVAVLDQTKAVGLDGVFFKSVTHISPTLDLGELREVKAHADALGLYLESSLGSINPYNASEEPHIRALGDGDTVRGLARMIEASAAIGCVDLGAITAHWQSRYPGRFAYDRFRTDVPWPQQLEAVEALLLRLAPTLRDTGCRISIETHEEITSFEIVRLIERVGPDVVSAGFDTGNVLCRCEDPVAAARRLAPFVRTTHIKDAVLVFDADGLVRQQRALGEGVLDWPEILRVLHEHQPDLTLSLEDNQGLMPIGFYDPAWLAAHPDLTVEELAAVVRLARVSETRIASGDWPSLEAYDAPDWDAERYVRIERSRVYLRELLARLGFDEPGAGGT